MQLNANRQVARVTQQDGEGSTWSGKSHRKTGFSPISVPDGRRVRGRAGLPFLSFGYVRWILCRWSSRPGGHSGTRIDVWAGVARMRVQEP